MKKLNQLRQAIESSNPYFKDNPDKLQIFVEEGNIIARGTISLSYEMKYKISIIIEDYPHDIANVIIPLLAYLKVNQPELFENEEKRATAIQFTPDFNNNETADWAITIQDLTESVIATNGERGEVQIKYKNEPTFKGEKIAIYLQDVENPILES